MVPIADTVACCEASSALAAQAELALARASGAPTRVPTASFFASDLAPPLPVFAAFAFFAAI
jgi:hypothetical protein